MPSTGVSHNYFPTLMQQYTHLSRYARWLPDENRRETWPETVSRYFDFFEEHLKETVNYNLTKKEREMLEDAILNQRVMPSMRCLMTAGPALKRDPIAGYNCLGSETLVTTLEYGIVPIKELVNKSVHIVDGNGNWTLSKCKSYGKQQLYKIDFATSGKGQFSIRATANHRWFTKDGSEILTSQLIEGTKLANVAMPSRPKIDITSDDYKAGIVHGIVFGDGQALYKKSYGSSEKTIYGERICKGFAIRLCGTSRPLLKYFDGYSYSYPKSYNGDPVVYVNNRAIDLKTVPDIETEFFTDEYIVGFIRGWLAADGSTSAIGQVSLSCGDKGKDWIMRYGPRYGFVATTTKINTSEGFGRTQNNWGIAFDRRWIDKDDFLLDYKKDNFNKIDSKLFPGFGKVISVEQNAIEEVYCFEVPTTQSFLLTKNLLTGNCSYVAIDSPRSFDEILYILMCGVGVGFSVESKYTKQLPLIEEEFHDTDTTIVVADSKIGWAKAYRELIHLLYSGQIPKFDVSKVRAAGLPLKTFGGRASGPEPLVDLFKFTIKTFKNAAGRKLYPIECHDIVCKIAEIVVVGGVRRSALISLSDLDDRAMQEAKSGQWWLTNPQRALANNSYVAKEKTMPVGTFMDEWTALYKSNSGERGIFSRYASEIQAEKTKRRNTEFDFGTNPCSEIILRNRQFCNLSEVVVRATDTKETLKDKVRLAAILGTIQSTLTEFRYITKKWKENCEEERLLGVSLTGIMDNELTNGKKGTEKLKILLEELRDVAIETNKEWAKKFGINQSTSVTCVKPSGTVGTLVDSAAGIHTRHSPYYIRTVRGDKKDPLAKMMVDMGFPVENCVMKPDQVYVFSFPVKAPEHAVFRNDMSAIEQLEIWKIYQDHWCEHKPSCTISVKEHEWMEVGAWVFKYFDSISGISFLPFSDAEYKQMPYQECTKEDYDSLATKMPKDVDWARLKEYEIYDTTTGTQEYACAAGGCEIV